MMRQQHQDDEAEAADQVAAIDDDPVTQHLPRRDFAARPGHHDQVVAGEQLGAPQQPERQSEREYESADYANAPEAQVRIASNDGVIERAEADAAACYHRQHE